MNDDQPSAETASILEAARQARHRGDLAQAENLLRGLLDSNPGNTAALVQLGLLYHGSGRNPEAEAVLRRAVELSPGDVHAHALLGRVVETSGDVAAAIAFYRRAVDLAPGVVEPLVMLGSAYRALKDTDRAIICFNEAVRLCPERGDYHNALGAMLLRGDHLEAAIARFVKAVELDPTDPEPYANLSTAYFNLGMDEESMLFSRKAVELAPDMVSAHFNLAVSLLASGDYAQGLAEYEWRRQRSDFGNQDFPQPEWTGEPPDGKTILLYADQGLGDAIQFIRYVPEIAALGAKVMFAGHPRLTELFLTVPGLSQAFVAGQPLPPFDLHLPLVSAAHVMGTRLDTIPAKVPYLFPEQAAVGRWKERLAGCPGLKVGLAWAGASQHPDDARRSLGREQVAALCAPRPGVSFVSLQLGDTASFAGPHVVDFGEEAGTMMETAALVANLDLVIAVDTSIAHLAGALGKPVWLLCRVDTDWRWLRGREDSPWYPTARIFRQTVRGDWSDVLERVAAELRAAAAVTR